MPKKKQKLTDKPTEKVIAKLFSPKAIEKIKAMAHEKDSKLTSP